MKRSIIIKHNDDAPDIELEIDRAVVIHYTDKEFIYLEKKADGKWRLTYSDSIGDFSKIDHFEVHRS